ncbi:MAG: type II toxin-antitoxin system Phd/YefM family antitoxin [Magnetococcales bacterium]|nr:type II toxin-antitoxin system Phd/YefM family antitoxin [Magnetococcales bacterium]NGZ27036.1 type II toxin-antitoxin system Phd/YefM family antitoxin [Magnetococcales bacterium]
MSIVNIHEAKTQLSRYVDQAATGEEIIIARAGKPVARLMPLAPMVSERKLGLGKGKFTYPNDLDSMHAKEIQDMFDFGQ